jgi:acyl-coenzyme A synthetase/AMP-(fatty) acid ligase/acyl carrier protein
MYGPAECSDVIATYDASREEVNTLDIMPVGTPVHNAKAYVLDENYNLLPIGVPGEICAGGKGVSRGYLNRPDLTAASFVPNPFEPGRRIYKTGDLGKWLESGTLEFVGRVDNQVKIRGQRMELDEVETVVNQYPAVRQNVVVAKDYVPGDKRLVAYVIPDKETIFNADELRQYLKSKLPEYMVPSYIVEMETFPLTTNGKVNRRALPDPDWNETKDSKTYVAPRNPVEEILAGIWAEILRVDKVSLHDDFFQIGGHSLLATRLITRVCREFNIDIPLRSIFEQKTIAEQAVLVEATIIKEITQADSQPIA